MTSPILQFFAYEHLPEHLQAVSKPFGDLARHLDETLPGNPEKSTALRKLLEAKDAGVRAVLFKGVPQEVTELRITGADVDNIDKDGWIQWHGGECPVPDGTLVDIRKRSGMALFKLQAGGSIFDGFIEADCTGAEDIYWKDDGTSLDIVAYRIAAGA